MAKPNPNPSANEAMMPKGMAEVAAQMRREGLRERKAPTKLYKKGGSVGSASKRADGIAKKGKTRGKCV
jgi:hypothetical protein